MDNGVDGFQLYSLNGGRYLNRYTTTPTKISKPRTVRFGEVGEAVVAGGHDGNVYVFNRHTSSLLDILPHSSDGCAAAVIKTHVDRHGKAMIYSASTDGKTSSFIREWKFTPNAPIHIQRLRAFPTALAYAAAVLVIFAIGNFTQVPPKTYRWLKDGDLGAQHLSQRLWATFSYPIAFQGEEASRTTTLQDQDGAKADSLDPIWEADEFEQVNFEHNVGTPSKTEMTCSCLELELSRAKIKYLQVINTQLTEDAMCNYVMLRNNAENDGVED